MQPLQQPSAAQGDLGRFLVSSERISASALMRARSEAARLGCPLSQSLVAHGALSAAELAEANSLFLGAPFIDLAAAPASLDLAANFDIGLMLRHRVLPWRAENGQIIFAISDSADLSDFLSKHNLERTTPHFVFAAPEQITSTLTKQFRQSLTARAAARVPETESCRTWEKHTSQRRLFVTSLLLVTLITLSALWPAATLALFSLWAVAMLFVSALMRTAAYLAEMSAEPDSAPPPCPDHHLPRVSVIVPLFKEKEIAGHLLHRLSRLTYPKALLDVVLAVEENDTLTAETIARAKLPPWMSVVNVPEGQPKTKPRALNYALDHCKGQIIGIWDAEDAPAADQLETIADHFHSAASEVACLQGVLDYYNSRQNWLARCFTIEYSAWFRLVLPGMARLGFAIPLGGTTLFFKRDALEKLGGWDAHNVTEDADLGFRLARQGYRTDVVPTHTDEEANCAPWAWIKQRSRWLKGYMVTYLVHMRRPQKLYRQLGAWRFLGFQAHFVSALSLFLLAPVLWSFWLVLLGFSHALENYVSQGLVTTLGLSFLGIELLNALINASAVRTPEKRFLWAWVPTMHFYYPLGALAAYKALYEMVLKPFYWDKTAHGLSLAHLHSKKRKLGLPQSATPPHPS